MKRSIIEDSVTYSKNNPGYYFSLRNQFNIIKNLYIDFDITYNRPIYSYKIFNDQYIFNLSIREKLLKNKLTLQLGVDYTPTKWEQFMNYSYKYIDFIWDGDNRKTISVSVQYNFSSAKKQFKSSVSNNDELKRIQ